MASAIRSPAMDLMLVFAIFVQVVGGVINCLIRDYFIRVDWYYPYLWAVSFAASQACIFPIAWWQSSDSEKGNSEKRNKPAVPWYLFPMLATFIIGQNLFANIAYRMIPGSIMQMMKGVKLIFTVLLGATFLGKSFGTHQWIGFLMNVLGMVMIFLVTMSGVGWASTSLAVLGLMLVIFGTLCGAVMITIEEYVMKTYDIEADYLCGKEGVWSVLMLIAVLLPVVNLLHWENSEVGLETMWRHNAILLPFLILFCIVGPDKLAARVVTSRSSSVVRALLECSRSALLWACEILFGWVFFKWSELFAFVVILVGTMVYNKTVKLPFLSYPEEDETQPLVPPVLPKPIQPGCKPTESGNNKAAALRSPYEEQPRENA